MKPFVQLLRQPVRFAVAVIMLTLASAFLCLGWGAVRSAAATSKSIEDSFLTVAVINDRPGFTNGVYNEPLDFEQEFELRSFLENSPYLRAVYKNKYLSAVSDSFKPVLSFEYSFSPDVAAQYKRAVLTVKITDVYNDGGSVLLSGVITGRPALCAGFPEREKITIYLSSFMPGEAEKTADEIEIGGEYIIYTGSYEDNELYALYNALSSDMTVTGSLIDYNYNDFLEPLSESSEAAGGVLPHSKNSDTSSSEKAVAVFTSPSGGTRPVYESDLENICRASANVDTGLYEYAKLNEEQFGVTFSDEEKRNRGYDGSPMIQKIDGDLESFLSDPANSVWTERIQNCAEQYNSLPVLGVERLESLYEFHENIMYISSGRGFSESDYKSGKKVCVISEQEALASGLKIGDKISLRLYDGEPPSEKCEALIYYSSNDVFEPEEFEIIGLYQNTSAFNQSGGVSFGADAVFVPKKALDGIDTAAEYLSGFTVNYVMENGSPEALNSEIASSGMSRYARVYDSGFFAVEQVIKSLKQSAFELFAAACAAFLAVLFVYMALFVRKQRFNAGLQLALGAGKKRASGFVTAISMIPAAAASLLGGAIGAVFLNKTVTAAFSGVYESEGIGEAADLGSKITVTPAASLFAGLATAAVCFAAIYIFAKLMAKKNPLYLMKNR